MQADVIFIEPPMCSPPLRGAPLCAPVSKDNHNPNLCKVTSDSELNSLKPEEDM